MNFKTRIFHTLLALFALTSLTSPFLGMAADADPPEAPISPPEDVADPADSEPTTHTVYFPLFTRNTNPLVYIPAGEFIMGSDSDGRPETSPEHIVFLDAYYIFQNLVTNLLFADFVQQTGYITSAEMRGWSYMGPSLLKLNGAFWYSPEGPGSTYVGREHYPVVHVSWNDAQLFCEWYGGRLPTEAEWEKAARGIDRRRYPWGDQLPTSDRANFCDWANCSASHAIPGTNDGYRQHSPVGIYPNGASYYGVLDMAGNLNEWVWDWYDLDYFKGTPYANPTGPETGEYKAEKGGSWYSGWTTLRSFSRSGYETPDHSHNMEGFRCVIPINTP